MITQTTQFVIPDTHLMTSLVMATAASLLHQCAVESDAATEHLLAEIGFDREAVAQAVVAQADLVYDWIALYAQTGRAWLTEGEAGLLSRAMTVFGAWWTGYRTLLPPNFSYKFTDRDWTTFNQALLVASQ